MDAERLSRWKETFLYYMLAYYYELLASTLARRWVTASFVPDIAETAGLRQRVKSDRDIVLHELGFFAQGTIEEAKDDEPKDDDNNGPSAARE